MAIINQFSSLLKLPGAYAAKNKAQEQADALKRKLEEQRSRSPIAVQPTFQPKPAISPAPVVAPQNIPQIDAIRRTLSNLTSGLEQIAKSPAASSQGANQAPTPPVVSQRPDTLRPIEDEVVANLRVSPEEEEAKRKLSNLMASRDLGIIEAEKEAIPLQAILGEQGRIERRAAVAGTQLNSDLERAESKRQAALDVAKTRLDIETKRFDREKTDEEKVDEFTDSQGNRVIALRDKKTGNIRREVLGTEQKKESQTDKDRAVKVEVIKVARPLLLASKGKDGYVDPEAYMKLRGDYAESIGDPKSFDDVFGPMLSPRERARLFTEKFVPAARAATAESTDDLLAEFLRG